MAFSDQIIPIQATEAATGCSACLQGDDGVPRCRSSVGEACAAPRFSGPADEVQRLMAALAPVMGFDAGPGPHDGTGWVRSLAVLPGEEVSLQLAAGRQCGAALADQAFQLLRGLLPDTDIYVTLVD